VLVKRLSVGVVLGVLLLGCRSEAGSAWTDKEKSDFLSGFMGNELPHAATSADRQRMADCTFTKFAAEFPGGSDQVATADSKKIRLPLETAVTRCAKEFAEWVYSQDEWVPSFKTMFATDCALTEGEDRRSWCGCMAEQASSHFSSPVALDSAIRAGASRSKEVESKVGEWRSACSSHLPTR
jgi:hypothetical protein